MTSHNGIDWNAKLAAALACRRHAALLDAERAGVSVLDVLAEGVTPWA